MTEFDADSLLAALQPWAERARQAWQALPAPPSGHGGPECQWCPLCQLIGVVRGEHPDIAERLAEAGAAVSNALRLLIDAAPGASPPDGPQPRPRPRVQRIVLDDET